MNAAKQCVTAEIWIDAPMEKVWEYWGNPVHIRQWNNLSEEWHTPVARNDLKVGGLLFLRMEKKDGSEGFNHEAVYDEVVPHSKISYTTSDNRKTTNSFYPTQGGVKISETFEVPEGEDPAFHQSFCQNILLSFKAYVEAV